MKAIPFIMLAALLLVGCESTPKRREVTTAAVAGTVERAAKRSDEARIVVERIYDKGTAAKSAESKKLLETVAAIQAELATAKAQIGSMGEVIASNAKRMDDLEARNGELERKASRADAAIWKRNAIIASLVALIGVWAALKFYFRVPFL